MDVTLRYKFHEHFDLKHELLITGDAELIEVRDLFHGRAAIQPQLEQDSDKDAFWGRQNRS